MAGVSQVVADALMKVREQSKSLDTGLPLHLRIPPSALVHEISKKGRRLASYVEQGLGGTMQLSRMYDECIDIVNYAAFLGALVGMIQEVGEYASSDSSSTPVGESVREG